MKKRFIAILLAAVVLVTLPTALVVAKETTTHEINFNIDGKYMTKNYFMESPVRVDANTTFGGELREKNGNWYLSPLEGNITIDGAPYEIVVKQLNHPRPVNYYLYYDTPEQKSEQWYCVVEVNIDGDKYTGWLWFWVYYTKVNGVPIPNQGQSFINFQGIIDGKITNFQTVPPYRMPVIE